jgi:hypothetical protein
MGPEPVVMQHVLGQDRLQMPSTQDQQPVQALPAGTGDPALAPSVRVRGPHRCSDHLQTPCPEDGSEGGREVAVTIVDQEAGLDLRLLQLPGQVPRLLDGPAVALQAVKTMRRLASSKKKRTYRRLRNTVSTVK